MMTYDFHGTWDAYIEELGPYVNAHTKLSDLAGAVNLYTKGIEHLIKNNLMNTIGVTIKYSWSSKQ